jgi:protoheme IX farnesyltransferase
MLSRGGACSRRALRLVRRKTTQRAEPDVCGATAAVAASAGASPDALPSSWLPSTAICAELAKSKLSALVTASAAGGFLMAGPALGWPASTPAEWTALLTICGGTFFCSAAANALNQRHEIPRDSRMVRTRGRPLVQGRATADQALNFAIVSGGAGTAGLLVGCGAIPAALGAANIALYAGVYTRMKPLSEWNTNAGAIVGGIPPLMGWAAAGGSLAEPEAALLFSALYLWQVSAAALFVASRIGIHRTYSLRLVSLPPSPVAAAVSALLLAGVQPPKGLRARGIPDDAVQ